MSVMVTFPHVLLPTDAGHPAVACIGLETCLVVVAQFSLGRNRFPLRSQWATAVSRFFQSPTP